MTTSEDFDTAVERCHRAAGEFVKGKAEPYKALFSHREDVTVANPFLPVTRGWENVEDRMERAASRWSEGEVTGFEERGQVRDRGPGIHRRDRALPRQGRRNDLRKPEAWLKEWRGGA
jgi:hypothetical protein